MSRRNFDAVHASYFLATKQCPNCHETISRQLVRSECVMRSNIAGTATYAITGLNQSRPLTRTWRRSDPLG
jgi:hypothetical protein